MTHPDRRRPSRALSQLLHPTAVHAETDSRPLSAVSVPPPARRGLRQILSVTGRAQWGVVFGTQRGGTLTADLFAPAGPPWMMAGADPFTHDLASLLGVAHAVSALTGGQSDWAGLWLIQPSGEALPLRDTLAWLHRAEGAGLIDHHTPLITAGWRDGALHLDAHCVIDNEPVRLPVRWR